MRHGHAVPEADTDALRELSSQGRLEAKQAAESALAELLKVEYVLSSPYVRACQTRDIVLDTVFGDQARPPMYETSSFIPEARLAEAIAALYHAFHAQSYQRVLLVGHQPLVGGLIEELCGLEPGAHRMSTASLAALDVDVMAVDCCKLRWLKHVL